MVPEGFALLILGLIGCALGLVLLVALMKMSHRQDHEARRQEKKLDPLSDVSVTK
jgi:beta-lactamase regulating signal transducer with metallopeptidase domain